MDIIKAVWEFADGDNDQCVSKDEMIALFEWGNLDAEYYAGLVDTYFASGDANEDGLLTWDEFNNWLNTVEYIGDQKMEAGEKDAMKSFFKFFDYNAGNSD
jgi:hypothetical protein